MTREGGFGERLEARRTFPWRGRRANAPGPSPPLSPPKRRGEGARTAALAYRSTRPAFPPLFRGTAAAVCSPRLFAGRGRVGGPGRFARPSIEGAPLAPRQEWATSSMVRAEVGRRPVWG